MQAEDKEAARRQPSDKLWHRYIIVFYISITVASGLIGAHLHHLAFGSAQVPGQAYVVAFTQDANASVRLTAQVYPNRPWYDHVDVWARRNVNGRYTGDEKFLLVIECPSQQASGTQSQLYSDAAQSQLFPSVPVTVYPGVDDKSMQLGCFKPWTQYVGIANVVLPGLETDQAIETLAQNLTVYETVSHKGRHHRPGVPANVIQVFKGCPAPAAALATSSPAPLPSASASVTAPSQAAPSAGCDSQVAWNLMAGQYYLPMAMQTTEVLKYVNLDGFSPPSVFPVPQITSDSGGTGQNAEQQYTWSSLSSLLPSFVVTNLTQAATDARYEVDDGVAWGLFGAAAFLTVDKSWEKLVVDWHSTRDLIVARRGKLAAWWKRRRSKPSPADRPDHAPAAD